MSKKFTIKFTISSIIILMVTFVSVLLTYLHYNNSINNSYKLVEKFTSTVIKKYEGTIDKYIGDAIMAFWGAPLDVDEPVLKAVLCAVEMQKKLEIVNQAWKKEGRAELITRIGLHYGITLVGNISSKDRMNYTIMGDSVNIAARLETINKEYGTRIMISNEVNEVVKDELPTRYIGDIELKGKTKATKIYTVVHT